MLAHALKYCLQAGHLAIGVSWGFWKTIPDSEPDQSFRGPGLQDVPHLHTQHSIKLIGKQADWQTILHSPGFENPTDSPDLKDLKDCCRERR
jgi:hypothetical protein